MLSIFCSLLSIFLGANINAQTEETQETALTLACCGGFLEVAQFLIDHGADIELGASTPLMEASQEGHIDIVKYLISKGSNIHAVTNTMDTALTYACANGHTRIAEFLLSCGADVVSYNEYLVQYDYEKFKCITIVASSDLGYDLLNSQYYGVMIFFFLDHVPTVKF